MDEQALNSAKEQCRRRIESYVPREGFCNVTWDETLCWDSTPAGSFIQQKCPKYVYSSNTAEYAFRECGINGEWKNPYLYNTTNGWTNYTNCFIEDTEFEEIKGDLARISLMSNIGYGISLVSLVIAVIIMFGCRRLQCKSNSLHINLFMAFSLRALASLVKDVLFVDGLGLQKDVTDKYIFKEDGLHWECKLIVTIFLYAVSASMMWLFMEGLYLHMLVYKTLFTERSGIRMYVLIGWLSPLLYMTPWLFARIYMDDTFCWNIDPLGYKWIIIGPIILTILINFAFFVNVVRVLCVRMKSHQTVKGNNQQLRKLAKLTFVLTPLFGILYILTSAYPHGINMRADMIYLYCEMFYNSFQGFLLAILFCFLNEEVLNEVRRCWYRQRRTESTFTRAFTLSSTRKEGKHNCSGSNRNTSVDTHKYQNEDILLKSCDVVNCHSSNVMGKTSRA